DDDMWYVITDGPIEITKLAPPTAEGGEQTAMAKPRANWTTEDKKKNNLDRVARDMLFKSLGKNMFHKVKTCKTAKEVWDKI
ncbi:hypothetical protein, partial [Serratia marcescens]|uniref:hypothetical protein n=1 Tax=Serratia marcescens TaxID=615 RepID=UPI00281426FF